MISCDTLCGFDAYAEKNMSFIDRPIFFRFSFDYQFFDALEFIYDSPTFIGLFNIFDPHYGAIPQPAPPEKLGDFTLTGDFFGLSFGQTLYLSENISFHSDLRYEEMVLASEIIFHDVGSETSDNGPRVVGASGVTGLAEAPRFRWRIDGRYQEFTPQVGINVFFGESLSSHLSYSESFSNQAVPIANDFPGFESESNWQTHFVDPSSHRQWELSFKKTWRDSALASDITFYHQISSNIQTFYDSGDETLGYVNTPAADEVSEGIMLNLVGEISHSLNIISNIGYNRNNISLQTGDVSVGLFSTLLPREGAGNRRYGTAKKIANLWLDYSPNTGALKHYSLAVGLKYVGDRYGDDDNTFILPSYTKADIFLKYTGVRDTEFSLSVRNIFDREYYSSSGGSRSLLEQGDLRGFFVSVRSTKGF